MSSCEDPIGCERRQYEYEDILKGSESITVDLSEAPLFTQINAEVEEVGDPCSHVPLDCLAGDSDEFDSRQRGEIAAEHQRNPIDTKDCKESNLSNSPNVCQSFEKDPFQYFGQAQGPFQFVPITFFPALYPIAQNTKRLDESGSVMYFGTPVSVQDEAKHPLPSPTSRMTFVSDPITEQTFQVAENTALLPNYHVMMDIKASYGTWGHS
jgi:hypothetical protein